MIAALLGVWPMTFGGYAHVGVGATVGVGVGPVGVGVGGEVTTT
jgi:hypothetical protein